MIWPAAILLITAACSTLRVRTDYSHSINFANFHTYSWLKIHAGNQLWEDRIRRDVDTQLSSKGWKEVPSGGQVAVAAFGATHQQPTLETFYDSFGPGFGGWYWGGFGWGGMDTMGTSTTQTVYTPVGSLVVDVFDAANKHLIWRGRATQALSSDPNTNKHKLEKAVAKMFSSFPPQQG